MKRLLNKIANFILISFSLFIILISILVFNNINNIEKIRLAPLENVSTTSYIYSNNDVLVKEMNNNFKHYVTYDDLSDDFINALISIEDNNFLIMKDMI